MMCLNTSTRYFPFILNLFFDDASDGGTDGTSDCREGADGGDGVGCTAAAAEDLDATLERRDGGNGVVDRIDGGDLRFDEDIVIFDASMSASR